MSSIDNTTAATGPKVIAVASVNMLTFTCMAQSLTNVCAELGMPTIFSTSAFWDKGLTITMKKAVACNPKYVMTIDHDSVFKPEDVLALVKIMDDNPDLFAVFPVQASRHKDEPLVVFPWHDYSTDLTQVQFGHFGCTIIRADLLKKMPQPWFMGLPNPISGEWDEEPVSDSDITFWRSATALGYKIAQANKVHIGHAQLCVRWITSKGLALQPMPEYDSTGKPANVHLDPYTWGKKPEVSAASAFGSAFANMEIPSGRSTDSSEPRPNCDPGLGSAVREPQSDRA